MQIVPELTSWTGGVRLLERMEARRQRAKDEVLLILAQARMNCRGNTKTAGSHRRYHLSERKLL